MQLEHIYHLYRRAAFGILPEEAEKLSALSREEVVDRLFRASETPVILDIGLAEFDDFFKMHPNPRPAKFRSLVKNTADRHLEFNMAWMERMMNSHQGLNERMTLFWAGVLVCRDNVITFVQHYNNTLRTHALGNFTELVKGVSREPAMMKYLNTNQNRRDHPNENFARELMELFTLGEGNYSENDIREAARAFTGYNFQLDGTFRINGRQHDFGEKQVLGWKGNFQGDDIIDIICNKRECARYVCRRMYRYFVNEFENEAHIDAMTDVFYNSYDIAEVMRFTLLSDWFYEAPNLGSKIKSPLDLMISIHKIVPYTFGNHKHLVFVQRLLGQSPLQPPNVAGWAGGRSWINTNTLMLRLKLAAIFVGDGIIPSSGLAYRFGKRQFGDRLDVACDWDAFNRSYGALDRNELAAAVCAGGLNQGSKELLSKYVDYDPDEYVIQLMSLPEFQLS